MTTTVLELQKGQNAPLTATSTSIIVRSPARADVSALLVTTTGKVRSDADIVFYNQPSAPGVRLVDGQPGALQVDLELVPADVAAIRAVITLDDPTTSFGQHQPPTATITGPDGKPLYEYRIDGLGSESIVIAVELYRRANGWKVRSVGQGYAGGFAALITDHGVTVDDEPVLVPEALAVRTVPGEAKLSLEKRERLNLRKQEVAKVLLTKGASQVRAKVLLVIDKTGSMQDLYRRGTVHRVVERMIPVAVQLDNDGELEAYLYGEHFAKLPNVTVADADDWSATYLHLNGTHGGIDYRRIGGYNDEIPIMREILNSLTNDDDPTLVLFFTDGGFHKERQIEDLIRVAATRPAFWQFIGLGSDSFGILHRLDTLTGRAVDNAGFFAVADIDGLGDADLYQLLLSEFPDWLRAARTAGIVR